MAIKLTRLTHKIAIQLHLVAENYHFQFSLQAASPETFGYTLVYCVTNFPVSQYYTKEQSMCYRGLDVTTLNTMLRPSVNAACIKINIALLHFIQRGWTTWVQFPAKAI